MRAAEVVGRLAPSPNGSLHLGHATSFLCAWWSARKQGGRVILRLEDVDVDRAGERYVRRAMEDLAWLGLDFDGPPIIQSTRLREIGEVANTLLVRGKAYPCTCSRKDLALAQSLDESPGAPQLGVLEARYPGTCRNKSFESLSQAEQIDGREAGIRFRVADAPVSFHDRVFGEFTVNVQQQAGDFLVLRRNKSPSYQLAVVVDDHHDGVTEVVRGRDLLDSTARQILLSEALGFPRPTTAHLPLVCDHEGRRLSKRHGAISLSELREGGVSPESVVAWAARALGLVGETRAGLAAAYLRDYSEEKLPRADIILPSHVGACFV